jgi:hypothetical protein
MPFPNQVLDTAQNHTFYTDLEKNNTKLVLPEDAVYLQAHILFCAGNIFPSDLPYNPNNGYRY